MTASRARRERRTAARAAAAPGVRPAPPLIRPPVVQLPVSGAAAAVATPAVRGGLQGGAAAFIIDGMELFHVASFTAEQAAWLVAALGFVFAAAQNYIEHRAGRKLIGARTG